MANDFQIEESYVISDLETLKVVSDPFRIRILEAMGSQPTTVKQVSQELDLDPKKLYYHIGLLEKHGLIVEVEQRVVSGIIEKWYQIRAHSLIVDRELLKVSGSDGSEWREMMRAMFEATLASLERAVEAGRTQLDQDEKQKKAAMLLRNRYRLTHEQYREIIDQFHALFERIEAMSDQNETEGLDTQVYGGLFIMHPMVDTRDRGDSTHE